MRLTPALLDDLVDAIAAVGELEHPADKQLSAFFRSRPRLGQAERGLIAEAVYAALRRRRLLEHLGAATGARSLALATLVRLRGFSLRELGDREIYIDTARRLFRLNDADALDDAAAEPDDDGPDADLDATRT